MKHHRWIVPFLLAVALGWLISRPAGPSFVRLPGAGYPAPAWNMADLDGRPVASTNYAGHVIVLNFWATWCPPCLRELPELKAFHREQATNGVVVIGAAIDVDGAAKVGPFARRNGLNYPVLLADHEVQQAFAISSLPSTIIIGREGRVAARYLGAMTQEELTRTVTPLLRPNYGPAPSAGSAAGR